MAPFCKSILSLSVLGLLVVVAALRDAGTIAAQPAPALKLTVSQDLDPVEASVGEEVRFRLNFNVSDAQGDPAALGVAVDLPVSIGTFTDPQSLLTIAAAEDVFHFGADFKGGTRTLISAVGGAPVPRSPVNLKVPVTFTLAAPGVALVAPESLNVQVRSAPAAPDGEFHFCPQPGRGGSAQEDGTPATLFTDFKRCLVIGHVSAGGRPAATLLAGIDVSVVERINDQSVAQTVIALSDAMQRVVVDADGDGIAEGVSLTLRLEAPVAVPVSINARRDFEVVVRHSDGINTVVLGEQRFVVKRRETSGEGRWVAVVGSDSSVFTDFCRQQSRGLSPKLTLLRNGVALGADARATATIEPWPRNAEPDAESGLYDLRWDVTVDWQRLQKLLAWASGDTLTLRFEYAAALGSADVTWTIAVAGIDATVFTTPEDLAAKRYDNGKTERDYFDDLVNALKGAGIRLREQPDKLEWPKLLDDPDEEAPNWDRVVKSLKAVKVATKAFKDAVRKVNVADALAGQKEWKIEVEVEFDVVDGSGNPVRNPDGTVKKKVVKVVIVFNPQRDANGSGSEATGEDKGEGPKLVVVIGQCGATAANGNNGNGGKATAKVTGPGSLGVAVGGDGASNTDATVNKDGGNGGSSKVEAGNKRRAVGQPGATGVAIGGNGGGAVAPNTNPGDGGDADAEAPAGAASGVVIRPGDSGKGTLPSRDHETKSGTGTAKNGDTIKRGGKQEVGAGQAVGAKGQGGKAKAGVARAESGKAPKRSEPDYEGNPTTGD